MRYIAPFPTLFQVCPKTELRVTLAAKEKLFENNCADLLSCKFNCNSKPYTHCVLLSQNISNRNVTLNLQDRKIPSGAVKNSGSLLLCAKEQISL